MEVSRDTMGFRMEKALTFIDFVLVSLDLIELLLVKRDLMHK